MSTGPAKVFIKIESLAEQQENMKNTRKTFKVLQKDAVDKENLAGRAIGGKLFNKAKSGNIGVSEVEKKKKLETKGTQTEEKEIVAAKLEITVEDLTTTENPGEHYWEILAEKRRKALEVTLEENKGLYERVEGLEEELNLSRQMLDEARNLVEVLTEMLHEGEEGDDTVPIPSTSGQFKAIPEENENEETDD